MAGRPHLVRKNMMLEDSKVKLLVERLGARNESEAIRIVIDDFLFADDVMKEMRKLRRHGTMADPYRRARPKRGTASTSR